MLDSHLKRGQHPEFPPSRWRPWTNSDFAAAVGVSANSVANWRNCSTPIPPVEIIPVLDALFSNNAEFAGHRRDLKEAWERAKDLVPSDVEMELELADDWILEHRQATTRLAAITLHQPRRANPSGRYYLDATVEFAPVARDDDKGRTVIIGLRTGVLDIDCTGSGYQIAQNSLIGRRAPHDHIKPAVDSFTISGPAENGMLDGSPAGEDHLAIIEPGPAGDGPISLTLTASGRAFAFAYSPDPNAELTPTPQSPNRDAILNLLYGAEVPRDPVTNRIILARARIRRSPPT
jgi:hypothetical protein